MIGRKIMPKTLWQQVLLLILLFPAVLRAQQATTFTIRGTVQAEHSQKKPTPIPYVSVYLPAYGIGTLTDEEGRFELKKVPAGDVLLRASYLGYRTEERTLVVNKDLTLHLLLKEDNFRLEEVVVTATASDGATASSSTISANAMKHLQASSLDQALALLPGGITVNPTLNSVAQINIRSISDTPMNALGAQIIQDGAPISNNANLMAMNPAVRGALGALGGATAGPAGGVDTRTISLENIESIKVIRGIPSVEYADLTSGAVLIRSKSGASPLYLRGRTNPNLYQAFVQKGLELGQTGGTLNLSSDYTRSLSSPTHAYKYYERLSGKAAYAHALLDGKWALKSILDVVYGRDRRLPNPDDDRTKTASDGTDIRVAWTNSGQVFFEHPLLKNVNYTLAASYKSTQSFYETLHNLANAPYTGTVTDGAVLSNTPGERLYDREGKEITHLEGSAPTDFARYLPSSYMGRYRIEGKELGLYAKLNATLLGHLVGARHRILIGTDYQMDGNLGAGKTFAPDAPPYRVVNAPDASFRPRSFRGIPFIHRVGAYIEDHATWELTPQNALKLQAGVRYDKTNLVPGFWSPRLNASVEILPECLFLTGGYGLTAKMPTLMYLYPEQAYFEYINLNELATTSLPESERKFITTTRVFDTQNPLLKVAYNQKGEVGMTLKLHPARLDVTLFWEKLHNGYSMSPRYRPVTYDVYAREGDGTDPGRLYRSGSYPVLATYYSPGNALESLTRGVELELSIARIPSIRTSFSLNGAYLIETLSSRDYTPYDEQSTTDPARRTHIGLYGPNMREEHSQRLTTALRATHNIPDLGLVMTLTTEASWYEREAYAFQHNLTPVAYVSKVDGKVYDFDPARAEEPEFKSIIRRPNESDLIPRVLPPLINFNLNVTKEIRDFARLSFFANNLFRSYPTVEDTRNPGTMITRNKAFFFGLELDFILR